MSISAVTHRFLICLDELIATGKIRSKRQFAMALGYHAQGLSEMTAHRRDVPLELIEKATSLFQFNPHFLFSGAGPHFGNASSQTLEVRNLTIVTDGKGDERIVHVPIPAQAGYGQMLHDPVFIQELPTYRLPDTQFHSGTYRSFEVAGMSMDPTFKPHDIAIAAFIEPKYWEQAVKSKQVYILVTEQEVLIKRVNNLFRTEKRVECVSDNPEFESYFIPLADLREIWKVRLKLTSHFDMPNDKSDAHYIMEQLEMQRRLLEKLQPLDH
jgi:hypothetical protein